MRLVLLIAITTALAISAHGDDPPMALSPELTTKLANLLERDWEHPPPWAEMGVAILKGDDIKSGKGWYTGAERRHDWTWLEKTFPEAAAEYRIAREEIPQLDEDSFDRIDRNGDEEITPADFAFSKNPLLEDDSPANGIFSRLDDDSNGRLTMAELERWFERSAGGTEFLSAAELKAALGLNPKPPRSRNASNPRPDRRWEMFSMLLTGELGSFAQGPELDSEAPELDLPLVAHDEEGGLQLTDRFIKLADCRGDRPVVLIFGSFT